MPCFAAAWRVPGARAREFLRTRNNGELRPKNPQITTTHSSHGWLCSTRPRRAYWWWCLIVYAKRARKCHVDGSYNVALCRSMAVRAGDGCLCSWTSAVRPSMRSFEIDYAWRQRLKEKYTNFFAPTQMLWFMDGRSVQPHQQRTTSSDSSLSNHISS